MKPGDHVAGVFIVSFLERRRRTEVYEARAADGEPRFLKIYIRQLPGTTRGEKLRRHQLRLMKRLSSLSRHVPTMYDFVIDRGRYMSVCEWIDGIPLSEMFGHFSDDAKRMKTAARLARSVAVVHEVGVAHLDLSPSNVLCRQDGLVLVDFDFAAVDEEYSNNEIGTMGYAAPELFRLRRTGETSRAVDVFALGMMIYELLSGFYPFARHEVCDDETGTFSSEKMIRALRDSRIPPLNEPMKRYSLLTELAVFQCLSPNPRARPSARQVAEILEESLVTATS